jgi:hypothetical protein
VSLQAFIDESVRAGEYIVCAVVVDSADVASARRSMRQTLKGSQGRVHMAKENANNKRGLLDHVASLGIAAHVVTVRVRDRSQRRARDACLAALARALQVHGVGRLVLESCDQDRDDLQVLGDTLASLGAVHDVEIVHLRAHDDPLLWVADIVAWAYGRAGDWGRRVAAIIGEEIRL